MECVSCNESDVFNRVIRNQVRGEEIGLFCDDCESETFGELLDEPAWHQENGCAFCDGAGKYQLPKMECLIETDGGEPRVLEFTTFEYTVTICRSHLDELLPHDESVEDLAADRRKPLKVEA